MSSTVISNLLLISLTYSTSSHNISFPLNFVVNTVGKNDYVHTTTVPPSMPQQNIFVGVEEKNSVLVRIYDRGF